MSSPPRNEPPNRSLVDFHCHLDLYPDLQTAIDEAEAARVYTLAVTTTPLAWERNQDLMAGLKFVRPALGLHPQLVHERSRELGLWEKKLAETRYVGEVGLDFSPTHQASSFDQRKVFRRMLECCAEQGGKILSIHSVRAASDVLELLETHLSLESNKVVLHWFTGNVQEAKRAVELGCFFSVNVNMTRTQKGHAVLKTLPFDRLLTETDGPFTSIGGRPARPVDVGEAVCGLAQVLRRKEEEVQSRVWQNLKGLLTS